MYIISKWCGVLLIVNDMTSNKVLVKVVYNK